MSYTQETNNFMTELSDFELVKKFVGESDEYSFNLLMKKYQSRIYWHCRRMLNDHLDADEVTQEVIIVLYQKLHTFKFESALSTWIYTITSTRIINFQRKKKIRTFFGLDDVENEVRTDVDIVQDLDNKQKLEKLDSILSKLPSKQKEVFIFRNYDELSYEEISQITKTSVGALKASYFHAQKKVMELMKNEI